METKIQSTLVQWFPDVFIWNINMKDHTDYDILQKLANYTIQLMQDDKKEAREAFRIIEMLYCKGNLKDRNAIENEFLCNISLEESPGSLKEHLQLMPERLKPIYLKTILEN